MQIIDVESNIITSLFVSLWRLLFSTKVDYISHLKKASRSLKPRNCWHTCLTVILSSLSSCHRMIPPSSKNFLVNNLAAGTQYDLCVLAIYDDVITSLTATRVVGCVQFTTESEYMRCHFMQSQFLGGTMIIIIGGIIVASVLVFIIILMIRYKVGLFLSLLSSVAIRQREWGKRAFHLAEWLSLWWSCNKSHKMINWFFIFWSFLYRSNQNCKLELK